MRVNPALLDAPVAVAKLNAMNDLKTSHDLEMGSASFAQRFNSLRGRMSFQALSDAIFKRTGIRITAQAMHKWSEGGNINRANARILADFFGVTEAWLYYGVGRERVILLEDAVRELDKQSGRAVVDFVRYHLERHSRALTADRMKQYLELLDRLVSEIEDAPARRKKQDS